MPAAEPPELPEELPELEPDWAEVAGRAGDGAGAIGAGEGAGAGAVSTVPASPSMPNSDCVCCGVAAGAGAGDAVALGAAERRGLELFRGKASCVVCHLGPNLTDEDFHNTGVGWNQGATLDLGRAQVTHQERDRGAFRTPTLREVASTGPYMHDGSLKTLKDVVDFYSDGGKPNPNLDGEMLRLDLTASEKADLIAFLHTLSGTVQEGPTR